MFEIESSSNIQPSEVSGKEIEVFKQIYSLLEQGAIFCGNFWTNYSEKVGCFEIRLEQNGQVHSFESDRCFPEIFGPQEKTVLS